MTEHEDKRDREAALASLKMELDTMPENSRISVTVQYVPLSFLTQRDKILVVNEGTTGAFLTATRLMPQDDHVEMKLFVKGGQ
jgi:hypothetical protein